MLRTQLAAAEEYIGMAPEADRDAINAVVAELAAMPPMEALASPAMSGFADVLIEAARNCIEAGRPADALSVLYAAHELARGTRRGGPVRQMRTALQLACEVEIREGIQRIADHNGDGSIDGLIAGLNELVASARGGEITLPLSIAINERLLRELDRVREAHDQDTEFERKLVRNNINAVLGLVLPQNMKDVQGRWRELAQHVAPSALLFAEQEYALPKSLPDLLGADLLNAIEQAVTDGNTTALAYALGEAEELLEGNLKLRLEAAPQWLPPESKVLATKDVPDQAWLRATDELSRGKPAAIDKFRNIDFTRQSRNIYARMWLAYALAKLGGPSISMRLSTSTRK